MPTRDNDHLHDAPSIVPARDEIDSFQRNQQGKAGLKGSLGAVPEYTNSGGGAATGLKALVVLLLVGLVATAALAGFLHSRLLTAESTLVQYESRLADLERRLSVTDESMSESSVAMKVKLRELDDEVRKLWDNVWKRSKQRFATIEKNIDSQQSALNKQGKTLASAEQQLATLKQQVAGAGSLKAAVDANKAKLATLERNLENTSDKANSVSNQLVNIERLSNDNRERLDSVDQFRRQVNGNIVRLQQTVGKLEAVPSGG
jgi:chromosome segregation ATPase